ncbi:MAG: N-acetylmuramoyl-L-alanine amidase [Butyrivibrio sp.]|nr:N-acetylmuramoyl-L-alanine amidase [Butyrivibrio sp.]
MTNEYMKKTAIKASVFAAVAMVLMLYRAATKHIMITDAAGAPIDRGQTLESYNLLVDRKVPEGREGTLIIPISRNVSSDNIILEDDYIDHELRIYIESREEGFYLDNPVVTDLDILKGAVCVPQNESGSVCLDFTTDELYVNESTLTENSTIEVKFFKPSQKYEHVAVIDVAGESDGAGGDPSLDVALLLKDIADKDTDRSIKLYFTRLSERRVSEDERLLLVTESEADLCVSLDLQAAAGDKESGFSAFFNDRYFRRSMTNAEFADIVLRNCASNSGTDAAGIYAAPDDDFIRSLTVPSARLCLDITGDAGAEAYDDTYKRKVAEGLYNAIVEALGEME